MKLLITGGLGYFGAYLTRHFLQNDFEVTVLSRSNRDSLKHLGYDFLKADLSDLASLEAALEGREFDYCIHAGSVNDHFVEDYAQLALDINAMGTRNLIECLQGTSLKRLIYFSTFHVYGRAGGRVHEDLLPAPKNDYGSTHYFAEVYLNQFAATHGFPSTILRLTNGYGAPLNYDSSKWHLVVNDLCKKAFEDKKITLNSNGKPCRDFIYMGDVCKIVEDLLVCEEALGKTLNVGSGKTTQMLEIAQMVKKCYESRYSEEVELSINTEDDREYDQSLLMDCSRLQDLIEIELKDAFEEEIHRIFDLLENHDS